MKKREKNRGENRQKGKSTIPVYAREKSKEESVYDESIEIGVFSLFLFFTPGCFKNKRSFASIAQ